MSGQDAWASSPTQRAGRPAQDAWASSPAQRAGRPARHKLIAGVDIGNSTTEVCIGQIDETGRLRFLSSAMTVTTSTKGTVRNVNGIQTALKEACDRLDIPIEQIDLIRINSAAPVVGDTAMETITETVITDSTMIGHNPDTPAGMGAASGMLVNIANLEALRGSNAARDGCIVKVPEQYGYERTASIINLYIDTLNITGLILQNDEAVLVENRLTKKIPIVDEVRGLERIPEGKYAAIEVAPPAESIRMLSNPYGIATVLDLTPEETKTVIPIAKSLIGKRSGVIVKTPGGNVVENVLPAGELCFHGDNDTVIGIDAGGVRIMEALAGAGELWDITGSPDTNIGNMLSRIRNGMTDLASDGAQGAYGIQITDLLAVDILAPVEIAGALAGETCLEKAVAVAAMVRADTLPMKRIADRLMEELGVYTEIAGVEAVMAALGALTTPGTTLPLTILDLGGGSTDSARIDENGEIRSVHLAGAGELVTLIIRTELGLSERTPAELIKRYPAAKVESLNHIRLENGGAVFFNEPLEPKFFGRTVLLDGNNIIDIEVNIPMEKIAQVRREAKAKVFVTNAVRGLEKITGGDLRQAGNVVLVGGSAEDFEIPEMLTLELSKYKVLCGRGNIRRTEGPRNAVATGLLMSY